MNAAIPGRIPNHLGKQKAWRTDTRALVGAVVLGVAFVLVQQVSQRIDAAIWPTLIIFGGITWATFTGLITLTFGQPAGVIMGETQALIAIATGLSPLALFFIPANGLGSLAYSLVARSLSMEKWSHHLAAQVLCNVSRQSLCMHRITDHLAPAPAGGRHLLLDHGCSRHSRFYHTDQALGGFLAEIRVDLTIRLL